MTRCNKIRLQLTLAGALALAACKTTGDPPIQTRIQYVDRPIATKPVKPEDVPAQVAPLGPRPGTLRQSADLLLAKWCEAVAYMLKADPLLRLSSGMPPADPALYPECKKR